MTSLRISSSYPLVVAMYSFQFVESVGTSSTRVSVVHSLHVVLALYLVPFVITTTNTSVVMLGLFVYVTSSIVCMLYMEYCWW